MTVKQIPYRVAPENQYPQKLAVLATAQEARQVTVAVEKVAVILHNLIEKVANHLCQTGLKVQLLMFMKME